MYNQVPVFIIGCLASASIITTTFWNQWSVSGPTSKGVLGPIWAWRSLFGECMQYQGGQSQCQGQNSMFLMSGYKLAIRGLMITSIILSTGACVGIILGMQCTKVFREKANFKRRLMFLNGTAFLISGIFTFTAVMWYTLIVYQEFFKVSNQDNYIQWELGACVYLGYVASFFSGLAFLACICRPGEKEEEKPSSKSYYYKPRLYKSSKDDELMRGLLDRYRSRHSRRRSSDRSSSSKKSSKRKSSLKHASPSKYERRDYGHKNSVSFSRSSRSSSIKSTSTTECAQCVDIASSVDTYRYSAYV